MTLLAHYPLNGDTKDYSGNGYHMTGNNLVTSTDSKFETSYQFNGDCKQRIYSDSTFPKLYNELSWSCWIKPSDTTGNQYIVSQGRDSGNRGVNLISYNGKLQIKIGNTVGTIESHVLSTSEWIHVAFCLDSQHAKAYINGKLVATLNRSKSYIDYNQSDIPSGNDKNGILVIGKMSYGFTQDSYYFPYKGCINDVRIYDHALSTKEVKDLYKLNTLYYKFDEIDNGVKDMSGYGYHSGSVPGTAKVVTTGLSKGTKAITLGTTDRISFPNKMLNKQSQEWTISYWCKFNATIGSVQKQIEGLNNGIGTHEANQILNYINSGVNDLYVYSGNMSQYVGKWIQVCAQYRQSDHSIKMFINGRVYQNGNGPARPLTKVPQGIGDTYLRGNYGGTMDMTEVKIYSRLLTESEVLNEYNDRMAITNRHGICAETITENTKALPKISFNKIGEVKTNSISEFNFKPTLVDYSNWEVGKTNIPDWWNNGDTATYTVQKNPLELDEIVLSAEGNDAASDADGGFHSLHYNIDPTKNYRISVWVKRKDIGNGRIYLGCNTEPVPVMTVASTPSEDSNPYFHIYSNDQVPNSDWLLVVGYVYKHNVTAAEENSYPRNRIYNKNGTEVKLSNGAVVEGTRYKFQAGAKTMRMRSYLYYSTSVNEKAYWCRPRMEELNDATLSIDDLIHMREHVPMEIYNGKYLKGDKSMKVAKDNRVVCNNIIE